MSIPREADVIIVGGGTAGCIIASRLSQARPDLQILLVESGGDVRNDQRVLRPLDGMFSVYEGQENMRYIKSKPLEHLGGRQPIVPVGNMLGGSSSINFMLYNNPAASDFDDWNQPGWSFEDLQPYIRKTESYDIEDSDGMHGRDGPMKVSYGGYRNPYGEAFFDAFRKVKGVEKVSDIMNFKTGHGCGYFPKLIDSKTGHRSNTAHAYLYSQALPPNITVITHRTVNKIILSPSSTSPRARKKAVGIRLAPISVKNAVQVEGEEEIRARKMVVICSGAFGSPMILERSGIGDKDRLESLGVDCEVDLKGVGENYQDHELTICSYRVSDDAETLDDYIRGTGRLEINEEWEKTGQGKASTNGFDFGYKIRPNEEDMKELGTEFASHWSSIAADKPDKPLYSGPFVNYFMGPHPRPSTGKYFSMGAFSNYPLSRGSVHISSASPPDPPDFDSGVMNNMADLSVHVWAYKNQREVSRHMPYYLGEHATSHPSFPPTSSAAVESLPRPRTTAENDRLQKHQYSREDDEIIKEWVKKIVGTAYHSMGTCAMRSEDDGGVVDERLGVYGVDGLKVADLSICPFNVGCNTTTVACIVGEKAAALIEEDLRS